MALEEEEELDYEVEYVEFDGRWWGCEWVASSIAGGWPRQTGPRLAILSGGPRGLSAVDQGDLEPSLYKFMSLWTLYEMAWFFMSPGVTSLLTCSPSSSSPFR